MGWISSFVPKLFKKTIPRSLAAVCCLLSCGREIQKHFSFNNKFGGLIALHYDVVCHKLPQSSSRVSPEPSGGGEEGVWLAAALGLAAAADTGHVTCLGHVS